MDEMKPLMSIGQTVEDYFMKAMLENLQRPSAFRYPNSNIRNEAYYAKREPEALNPDTHCVHCGHSLDDPDY